MKQHEGQVRADEEEPSSSYEVAASLSRPSHISIAPAPARWLRWAALRDALSRAGELIRCPPSLRREAPTLAREEGMRALRHFDALFAEHCGAIIDAAFQRFCQEVAVRGREIRHPGAHFRYVVRCQAIAWAEQHGQEVHAAALSEQERGILAALAEARRKARSLRGPERRVFRAMCALDSIAFEDEAPSVVLCAAVAFSMRRGTAYQHISRVRRKLFSGPGGDALRDAWKYLLAPPLASSLAAREYLDACEAREAGLERWMEAHKAHNQRFNTLKRRSQAASQAWRGFVSALDACPQRPADVQAALVALSRPLGIDAQVVPAKLREISWRGLLGQVKRPARKARRAWGDLIRKHAFGAEILAAWGKFEREAALAEAATASMNDAYDALLDAACARPQSFLNARDEFRRLVDKP